MNPERNHPKRFCFPSIAPVVLSLALTVVLSVAAQASTMKFEPLSARTTFLRADRIDTITDSTGISLASLSTSLDETITPGSTVITLWSVGDICFFSSCGAEEAPTFLGVFSTSAPAPLAAQTNLQRVANYMPLPAGATNYATGNTYHGLPTAIPEAFLIPGGVGTSFVVPAGAVTLYLGIADSWYVDNSDPNVLQDPLGVFISVSNPASPTPEPGSAALFCIGMGGLLVLGRRALA